MPLMRALFASVRLRIFGNAAPLPQLAGMVPCAQHEQPTLCMLQPTSHVLAIQLASLIMLESFAPLERHAKMRLLAAGSSLLAYMRRCKAQASPHASKCGG